MGIGDSQNTFESQKGSYKLIKQIGNGGFGTAHKAKCHRTGDFVVIKVISMTTISDARLKKDIYKEAKILKKLKHEYIIGFREVYVDESDQLCIVMDYADGGDLYNRISEAIKSNENIPEETILMWFKQICEAIEYIHKKKIIHRDIKPQNIFLMKDDSIRIGDFGVSRILEHTSQYAGSLLGTTFYIAPEIWKGDGYKNPVDIWAMGILLFQL